MKFQSICLWGIYCPLWGSKSPPSPQESEILEEAAEAAAFCGSNISTILDLKGFYPPAGKAKTKQNYTLGLPVSPLGNSATSPTEQQEKSHSFPQRFYHLSLGMGEASPPSSEQESAFCWLFFYVIRTNSLEMSHTVSRVSREMSSRPQV